MSQRGRRRCESLVLDDGFAMITGEPGTGKSVLLRTLAERLGQMRNLQVGIINRPQSGMSDFYRDVPYLPWSWPVICVCRRDFES